MLHITENRYSGIPTIRKEFKDAGLPASIFSVKRGEFTGMSRYYTMSTVIQPLVDKGKLKLTILEKPKSSKQKYVKG